LASCDRHYPPIYHASGLSGNLFGAHQSPAPIESQCACGNNGTPEPGGTLPPCQLRSAAPFCTTQDETQHKLSKRSAGADEGLLLSANDIVTLDSTILRSDGTLLRQHRHIYIR